MDRRSFNALLFGSVGLLPTRAKGSRPPRLVLYSAAGDQLTRYIVNAETAELTRHEAVTLPSAIQYAWLHPSNRYLYVATSDAPGGSRRISGSVHRLCAFRIESDGRLSPFGNDQSLPQRPIHLSVDWHGRFLLVAYNTVADISVHPIAPDGSIGPRITQTDTLDTGIFPHQVRAMPGDRTVVLVTRGNDAGSGRPEDPGALKLYHFDTGDLSPMTSIAVGGHGGLGYGPRHLDFHPTRPWVYVSIERQNALHMHRMDGDNIRPDPAFIRSTTDQNDSTIRQVAGAIHVHPNGKAVYLSNRASGTIEYKGQQVAQGGDNSIAVFSIDPATGEPTLVQHADPRGFHVRSFTIDPSGTLLIAATMVDIMVREGEDIRHVAAGLTLFRIADDGQLDFVRKYDVDLPPGGQQVWVQAVQLSG